MLLPLSLLGLVSSLASGPIEVPFRLGDSALIVDVTVNGRPCSLMFDTGFSGAFVLSDRLDVGKPTGTINLQDFVGVFQARTVPVTSVTIGGQRIEPRGMTIVQQPLEHLSLSYNTHTDGILGMEPFRDYVLEISFSKKRLVLHKPESLDISTRTPDNKKTFLARVLPIGRDSIKMRVELASGEKLTMALDTGNAFFATTHKDVLQRVALWDDKRDVKFMRSAMVASGPVDSWYKLMPPVTIFGVPVESSVWSIIDLPSSSAESDGTVGFDFLKNFDIVIDLQRRRVWLENFTGEFGNKPRADVGISAFFDPRVKRMVIARVTPGSPAERAGIRKGDHLLGIDRTEVLDVGFREVERLLSGEKGSVVVVSISRGGNLMRFELVREFLVNGLPDP